MASEGYWGVLLVPHERGHPVPPPPARDHARHPEAAGPRMRRATWEGRRRWPRCRQTRPRRRRQGWSCRTRISTHGIQDLAVARKNRLQHPSSLFGNATVKMSIKISKKQTKKHECHQQSSSEIRTRCSWMRNAIANTFHLSYYHSICLA